mmetsp:Transcript_50861/g.95141  ORF Transcript_50861/g.95141 Transcript_50861/m.95141 type:complete len:239 (-) Transcript_50861:304-1020(-)
MRLFPSPMDIASSYDGEGARISLSHGCQKCGLTVRGCAPPAIAVNFHQTSGLGRLQHMADTSTGHSRLRSGCLRGCNLQRGTYPSSVGRRQRPCLFPDQTTSNVQPGNSGPACGRPLGVRGCHASHTDIIIPNHPRLLARCAVGHYIAIHESIRHRDFCNRGDFWRCGDFFVQAQCRTHAYIHHNLWVGIILHQCFGTGRMKGFSVRLLSCAGDQVQSIRTNPRAFGLAVRRKAGRCS